MRLLVCGGRDFSDYARLYDALDAIQDERGAFSVVIAGRHPGDPKEGADYWAESWSWMQRIPFYGFPARWYDLRHPDALIRTRRDGTKYDAKAGPRRNQRMIDEGHPDLAVGFSRASGEWGSGTLDMLRRAKAAGIPRIRVGPIPATATGGGMTTEG